MKIPRLSLIALAAAALAATPAAAQYTFSNPIPITTPSSGPATLYPSTIVVGGVPANFERVTVTISEFSYFGPEDADILLVGPQGQSVVLLSDAGNFTCDGGSYTLTFDDGAPAVPQNCSFGTGTFAPTDYEPGDAFPHPAPPGPYGTALSGFAGTDPTGIWRLYVVDDQAGRSGSIAGGWSLTFHAPAPITYQGQLKNGNAPVNGSADLAFTLWSDPTGGTQVGPTVQRPATAVQGGLFTVLLDFGSSAITTPGRWLEIAVDGVTLSPRQPLSAAPLAFSTLTAHTATIASTAYSAQTAQTALTALTAQSVPWSGLTGVPAGFADGVDDTGGGSQWSNIASGISYTGPGGTNYNGIRLTHGTLGSSWDLIIGGQANSFAGGFAVAEAGSAKLVVQATTGNVGIGTTSPTALLSVNGSANKPGGGSWSVFSDRRLKHDITPLEGSLGKLLSLRGVSFVYDDPEAINELPGRRIGMVAQEVEGVFPDWVETGASGYKSLTFRGFEALAIEALRELRAENTDVRGECAALRAENAELRRVLEELRAAVADLALEQGKQGRTSWNEQTKTGGAP